jgi:hypothetical protein
MSPSAGKQLDGFYVTNSTFAALSMKNGDAFAKKFGGISGADPDFFVLTVKGYNNGSLKSDSVNFYLADYRSADNTKDYIVKTWEWVDLKNLGNVDSIRFSLTSSDVGSFGMNTPAYFCIDNFTTRDVFTGIDAQNETVSFRFYPNPAKDFVLIEAEGKEVSVAVYDLNGRLLLQQEVKSRQPVSVGSLPAGLYLLQVTRDGQSEMKKLVIE